MVSDINVLPINFHPCPEQCMYNYYDASSSFMCYLFENFSLTLVTDGNGADPMTMEFASIGWQMGS